MHNFKPKKKKKNLSFKQFIDDIDIDLKFFKIFVNMEDIRSRCNLMIDFSKFSSNE